MADAIWRDDGDDVRALVRSNPALLHEHVLLRQDSDWGPPMTYAANLGRDAIIRHAARTRRHATSRRLPAAPHCRARSRPRGCSIALAGEPQCPTMRSVDLPTR